MTDNRPRPVITIDRGPLFDRTGSRDVRSALGGRVRGSLSCAATFQSGAEGCFARPQIGQHLTDVLIARQRHQGVSGRHLGASVTERPGGCPYQQPECIGVRPDPEFALHRWRLTRGPGETRGASTTQAVFSPRVLHVRAGHRRTIFRERGGLFVSESRRNRGEPITPRSWSKVVRSRAVRAELPAFSTHTLGHLCLTDLARSGWELHEIAPFAGGSQHADDAAVHPPVRARVGGQARGRHERDPLRACGAHQRGARVSVAESLRSEGLAQVHGQLVVAHASPPERNRERVSLVGRCFGDRRASGPSPCLRRLYKAGTDALSPARRGDGEILDPQTRRLRLRRDFSFRCVFWRQQSSDERADDLTFDLGDEVKRSALAGWGLGSELFGEGLEQLKVVGSEVEVVARDLGVDPRERLLVTPPGRSHGYRLHCLELTDLIPAGNRVDNDRVTEEEDVRAQRSQPGRSATRVTAEIGDASDLGRGGHDRAVRELVQPRDPPEGAGTT